MTKFNDFSKCIVEDDCLKSDGDGIPDAAELLAPSTHAQGTRDTNPLDPASTFHIHSLQPAADGMRLQLSPLRHRRLAKPRLPAVPGKSYRVEYSEDLTQNQWSILLDNIPGTGTVLTVIDPSAPRRPNPSTG